LIFTTKLSAFEGPLDLLLHLIDKNKIDIYDIPISTITDQYLEYLEQMDEGDMDLVSEFLVMAATLLDIKSRMLLPKEVDEEGNEEDPRAELVQKLLEYKLYKYMSMELKDKEISAAKSVYREENLPDEVAAYEAPIDLDMFIGDVTLGCIREIFVDVIARSNEKINVQALEYGRIQREEVKIDDRIEYIRKMLSSAGSLGFRGLLEGQYSKINVIVTFLALLELMKAGEITARQSDNKSDIILYIPE
jgi:segregation and condensation protein A